MTDYEVGNELMHKVVDELRELSRECKDTHPKLSRFFESIALDFGCLVNDMMDDGTRMCPENEGSHSFFNTKQMIGLYEKK